MKNFEGVVTYTLLRACEYIKDNRLLPAGFDKDTAHECRRRPPASSLIKKETWRSTTRRTKKP